MVACRIREYNLSMSSIIYPDFLSHHAYCLIGGDSARAGLILSLGKKHKVKTRGNPDFFDRTYQVFTIDDARELKALAMTRPTMNTDKKDTAAGTKIFILTMNGITVEAQNALLKLLEEPPEYAHIFLIIPSAHLLLPTVKSRLSMIDTTVGCSDADLMKEADDFLKAPVAKRLETIKSLMNAIAKDLPVAGLPAGMSRQGRKIKQDAIDLINAIEAAAYAKGGVKKNRHALEAIALARKYMNDRSPSMKMLLEYMALNI